MTSFPASAQPPAGYERLLEYTRTYADAARIALEARDIDIPEWFRTPSKLALMYLCSDGAVTFYEVRAPGGREGGLVRDLRQYTLNQVVSSLHLNYLKVAYPPLGVPFGPFPLPENTERIAELENAHCFNDEVVQAFVADPVSRSLPGVAVTPVIHQVSGLRSHYKPCRVKVWSPIVEVAQLGPKRLYSWSHADFWWQYDQLDLSEAAAISAAEQDALSLATVVAAFGSSLAPPAPVSPAPTAVSSHVNQDAATLLEQQCEEFVDLLRTDPVEELVHQWLLRHKLFLDVAATRVWSKMSFGGRDSDFVVRRSDGTYLMIEIERPSANAFNPGNQEPSAHFNHAVGQVRDWQTYVARNLATVENELGLTGIYQPEGRVVVGRDQHLIGDEAVKRWRHLKNIGLGGIWPLTFDDLVVGVRQLAANLRETMRSDPGH